MQNILSSFVRPSVIILIAAFAMVRLSSPVAPMEHAAGPGGEGHANASGVATEDVFLAPTCSLLCDPAVISPIPDVDMKPELEPTVQSRPQDDAVPQDGGPSLFPSALLLLVCILAACVYHCVQLRSELARRPERDATAAAGTKAVDGEHPAEIDVELVRSRAELMALAASRLDDVVAQEGRARHSTTDHCDDEWTVIAHQFTVGMQLLAALASQRTAHEEEMRTVREACRAITNTKKETIRRLTESKADDAARHEAEKEASQRLTDSMAKANDRLELEAAQQAARHEALVEELVAAHEQQTRAHEHAVRELEAAHTQALAKLHAQTVYARQLSADAADATRRTA